MSPRGLGAAGLAICATLAAAASEPVPEGVSPAPPEPAAAAPASLGAIRLDRAQRTFVVPGRFLERDPGAPHDLLEYLAVKRDGYKAYEAVLELETTATAFNLACILIGLDPDNARLPAHHFDPRPVQGDPVELWIEWEQDGATRRIRPAELVVVEGEPSDDHHWVYTGSTFTAPESYLAEQTGTLIGFVHDQDSIIEHRNGIGLGAPHPPTVNRALLPPEGTGVRLVVRSLAGTDESTPATPAQPGTTTPAPR